MASHSISISLLNTQTGTPISNDGIFVLVCHGTAVSGFSLDTMYLLSALSDLDTLNINAAYDTTNAVNIYKQVSQFFAEAGAGAKVWLLGVAKATAMSTYIAAEAFKTLIRGTVVADANNLVKGIGICYKKISATQSSTDFDSDAILCVPAIEVVIKALFAEGISTFAAVDMTNMSTTITPTTIGTYATKVCPQVCPVITGFDSGGNAAVGAYMGRLAKSSVGVSPGKVNDGAIGSTTMYLTNGVNVNSLTLANFSDLGTKQFVFARTWFNQSGYYWNDGATADLASNAFSVVEFNRIANKLTANALYFFTQEIGSNLPVASDGSLDSVYCVAKQGQFKSTYINPLINNGDISNATLTVTGATYSADKTLRFKLKILASNALGNVTGTIEFVTTL
jgi:hypothetical protein